MSVEPRGARRNTEAAVLDAAAELLAEEGFQKLTMEGVARRARAGKATVYRWWPSRGHLLLALYSRAKSQLVEPDRGDLAEDLADYLGQMLAQLNGEGGAEPLAPILRLLIAEAQADDAMRAALAAERAERWTQIGRIVERAKDRGQLNLAISVHDAQQRVIAMMWYLVLNDSLPKSAEAGELVRTLMVGLRG
ncbi:MAG: TetR/AcrR family transcriptional regulator [Paracoccus sp. (in: a-proteobacteria)]|nr:TetR/AcrR family transcriptional regulator [Paracoccus sp. (in: a-proteobacteria)]